MQDNLRLDIGKAQSAKLDSAAAALGEAIARAIANALGIKSPSRVLMAMMDDVGDGTVIGLDNQASKIENAAARMSSRIAVSPEVAAYAALQGQIAVSGNTSGMLVGEINIHTPTENPEAVAYEVLDEVTGRLP